MTRLLLLLALAAVLLLARRWRAMRRRYATFEAFWESEDGVMPPDPYLGALTYYWQTPAGVQPVVQVVPQREAAE